VRLHAASVVFISKGGAMSALDKQIGGSHYKNFKIQPIEFTTRNGLGFIQGDVIKRICRYNLPGGKQLQDLEKIIHEVQILIEIERFSDEDAV
jgi:hypothetical protein